MSNDFNLARCLSKIQGFGFEILPWDLQRELFEVSVAHCDGQLEVVEGAGLDLNFVSGV